MAFALITDADGRQLVVNPDQVECIEAFDFGGEPKNGAMICLVSGKTILVPTDVGATSRKLSTTAHG
jgi:uncharacterized protein YlzI (FlbEa/FlbD family)